MKTYHIVIADDHPMYVDALSLSIRNMMPGVHLDTAHSYGQLFEVLNGLKGHVDLVIADLMMPDGDGGGDAVQSIQFLCQRFSSIPIIVLSGKDDFITRQSCLDAGVGAFLSKCVDSQTLREEIRRLVAVDDTTTVSAAAVASLTPSQKKVLELISRGLSNKQIAAMLGIAEKTVKVHVSAIFEKLGVKNRTQAALFING